MHKESLRASIVRHKIGLKKVHAQLDTVDKKLARLKTASAAVDRNTRATKELEQKQEAKKTVRADLKEVKDAQQGNANR